MTSKFVYIPVLVEYNYLSLKRRMIVMLRSKNLWGLVKGKKSKPIDAKELEILEYKCDRARGFIGQTLLGSYRYTLSQRIALLRYRKL